MTATTVSSVILLKEEMIQVEPDAYDEEVVALLTMAVVKQQFF